MGHIQTQRSVLATLLLMIGILFSTIALATQFEATVNTTQVSLNKAFQLKLVLIDAIGKGEPDLSNLQEYFTVHGVQKFNNFSSINGKSLREEGWHITLLPKMPGELIIPVIAVKTDKGMQYTQAINVYVDTATMAANSPIKMEAIVEKNTVFVQESFVYTLKIFNELAIANASLDKLEIANCMVEEIAKQKHHRTIINGKQVEVTEVNYLITPLKAGSIEIPPVTLRGEIQTTNGAQGLDPFDNMSLFGNFRQMHAFEPFTVQTAVVKMQVKAAIADIKPWLPLYSLEADEMWQGLEKPKVGEPIMRTITLRAIGVTGQQLPSVKDLNETEGVKVYADAPTLKHAIDVKINKVTGSRKEQLSIIPTKAGIITIPAMSIAWLDLNTGKKTITVLPAKQIEVAAVATELNNVATTSESHNANINTTGMKSTDTSQSNIQIKLLYSVIVVLVAILVGVGLFVWHYFRKMQQLLITKQSVITNNIANKQINDINLVNDLQSLQEFIRSYAVKNWQLPENLLTKELPVQLTKYGYTFDAVIAEELFMALDKALYGGGDVSVDKLNITWQVFCKTVVRAKIKPSKDSSVLAKLNPT